MAAELDLRALLEVLERREVSYVMIGGMAAVLHGSPFPTEDLDITPAAEARNLQRLSQALRDLDARIRVAGQDEALPFDHDADSLAGIETLNLVTRFGDLDLSFTPAGTRGYPDLVRDAAETEIFGVLVRVASLADVVRSKQAANRPKDQRVLPALRELLRTPQRPDPR